MKINEATLISYATSNLVPADKEGWLWKRGEVNKAFQKRYFVLKGNLLFYFEKQTDREPVGVIILEGCTIELAEEEMDAASVPEPISPRQQASDALKRELETGRHRDVTLILAGEQPQVGLRCGPEGCMGDLSLSF